MNGPRKFSRRALWLAVNSDHGDRLNEIMHEHVRIAHELIFNRSGIDAEERVRMKQRIKELSLERDDILSKFEGGYGHEANDGRGA